MKALVLSGVVLYFAVGVYGCTESQPCGRDSVHIDHVYFESGSAVNDTTGAHRVFDQYVESILSSGASFPDSARAWSYEWAEPSRAGFWAVWYHTDADEWEHPYVYVDHAGRLLRATFFVHAPC